MGSETYLSSLVARYPIEIISSLSLLFIASLLLMALSRAGMAAKSAEVARLSEASLEKDRRLTDMTSRADRAETLLVERESENTRLATEITHIRQQAATDQKEISALTARISGLTSRTEADAEKLAEFKSADEKNSETLKELRQRVEAELKAQQSLKSQISSLEAQKEAERIAAEEKITLLTKIRDDMQERFRQIADEALKTQGEAFSKVNTERLEATLSPLKEHVGHFEKELREVHQETVKDRERLKAEILQLTKRSEAISQEAVALTRALKKDHQQQGAWGEMVLEGILERSGLRKGEEYLTQANRTGAEGERLRPDVVVLIPGGKTLVIDSKVSLNDYTDAVNIEDEVEAALARKRHVTAMRTHINGLSSKSYQLAEGQSVDYVIMFVPIEGALSEALREDGKLTEYALERHITIATPTTLMMAMRTVSHVWSVERRNQNAENIAKRAGHLYDKVAGFVASMEKVGKGIENASNAYESAFGQLSRGRGNILSQVESLKTLGARTSKALTGEFEGKAEARALIKDTLHHDSLEIDPEIKIAHD